MDFIRDTALGRGWIVSICGRYRICRFELHLGMLFVAYDWRPPHQDIPELIEVCEHARLAIQVCELNRLYGGSP